MQQNQKKTERTSHNSLRKKTITLLIHTMKEDSIPVLTQILAIPTPPEQAEADEAGVSTAHTTAQTAPSVQSEPPPSSALSEIPTTATAPITTTRPIPVLSAAPAIRPVLDAREVETLYQTACAQITAQLTQDLYAHLEQHVTQTFQQALPKLLVDLQQQVHQNLSREIAVKIPLIVAQALSHKIDPPSNQ